MCVLDMHGLDPENIPMRNIFKKFGREGKNPGGLYQPPLGVFGWRNTLGIILRARDEDISTAF